MTEFIHNTSNAGQEQFADPAELQQYLVSGAHEAYEAASFDARTQQMAEVVADEAAELASASLSRSGASADRNALRDSFYAANVEAGRAFADAFDIGGAPVPDNKDAVRAGQKAAGTAALRQLPGALHAAGVDVADPQALLNTMTFQDVVRLTAAQLEVPEPTGLDSQTVRLSLLGDNERPGTVDKNDYFYDRISDLPLDEEAPLTVDAERVLDVAVRLFNATWKTGQVHMAANEGKDDRINPQVREAFNPYDLLKTVQYQRLLNEGYASDDATVRVAFEVWKDVAQGQQPASQEDVTTAQAYRLA